MVGPIGVRGLNAARLVVKGITIGDVPATIQGQNTEGHSAMDPRGR